MDTLIDKISDLSLKTTNKTNSIIIIQKWFRGWCVRKRILPFILYKVQKYLKSKKYVFSNQNNDGRINSSLDEDEIIKLLMEKFNNVIKIPKTRMWYDILLLDKTYGWLPINIKTTTMMTSDNTGNLTMCVYSYTDIQLSLDLSYENGNMAVILFNKLSKRKYNRKLHKDYYFIVLNKNSSDDIIINSIKGLISLTANVNNLPFQVCWNKNRVYHYDTIENKVSMFIKCMQKPKPSWKETFLNNMRSIKA